MKIKLVSDLHLEFSDYFIKNDEGCDVLILGGDIMIATDLHDHPEPNNTADQAAIANGTGLGRRQLAAQRFRDFLKRCSFQFPHVIYIAGNHEFYNGKWTQSLTTLSNECAKFPNVYFLEAGCKKIDDVTFIGGTLWTDMNKHDPLTLHAVRDMMNDFRVIKKDLEGYTNLKPADTVVRHRHMLGFIKQVVAEKLDEKFVVVGHHSPSFQSVHDMYRGETLMNGAYHSDLSEFILDRPQIKLWTHGHTHHPFDYMIGETRIVCNPRGYESDGYSEDSGWNPNIVLEV
jgi:DNA repair exonuclease SbcCD nuclease subunit